MFVIIPNSVPDFLFLFLFFLFFFYEYQILFCHFYFSGVQEINMDNLDKDSFNVFNNLDFMYVNSYHCERNFISSFCFYPSFFFFCSFLLFTDTLANFITVWRSHRRYKVVRQPATVSYYLQQLKEERKKFLRRIFIYLNSGKRSFVLVALARHAYVEGCSLGNILRNFHRQCSCTLGTIHCEGWESCFEYPD